MCVGLQVGPSVEGLGCADCLGVYLDDRFKV